MALSLFAAAACHRSPHNLSATGEPLDVSSDTGVRESTHDPASMTAIDVATGDVAGYASYAGDRAVPVVASHYGQQPEATNQTSDVLEDSVADADEAVGEQTTGGSSSATPITEDHAIPPSGGAAGKSP